MQKNRYRKWKRNYLYLECDLNPLNSPFCEEISKKLERNSGPALKVSTEVVSPDKLSEIVECQGCLRLVGQHVSFLSLYLIFHRGLIQQRQQLLPVFITTKIACLVLKY